MRASAAIFAATIGLSQAAPATALQPVAHCERHGGHVGLNRDLVRNRRRRGALVMTSREFVVVRMDARAEQLMRIPAAWALGQPAGELWHLVDHDIQGAREHELAQLTERASISGVYETEAGDRLELETLVVPGALVVPGWRTIVFLHRELERARGNKKPAKSDADSWNVPKLGTDKRLAPRKAVAPVSANTAEKRETVAARHNKRVGARLRAARQEAEWSQEQLACAIPIKRSYLSRFETGTRRISDLHIERLGVILNRRLLELGKPPIGDPWEYLNGAR